MGANIHLYKRKGVLFIRKQKEWVLEQYSSCRRGMKGEGVKLQEEKKRG